VCGCYCWRNGYGCLLLQVQQIEYAILTCLLAITRPKGWTTRPRQWLHSILICPHTTPQYVDALGKGIDVPLASVLHSTLRKKLLLGFGLLLVLTIVAARFHSWRPTAASRLHRLKR
jgi:hypothetical protein